MILYLDETTSFFFQRQQEQGQDINPLLLSSTYFQLIILHF